MRIYKDLFTGDEMSSDVYPTKELNDGLVLEVETKQMTRSLVGNIDIGANPSEEEPNEDAADDSSVVTVNNLIDAHKLIETVYDKKSYMTYIKGYMKRVLGHIKEHNPGRVEAFQKNAQEFVKKILDNFDNFVFYTGEQMDPEAMVALKFYKDDGVTPYFYFWKDGLKDEKY